jgi:hypothetical protein
MRLIRKAVILGLAGVGAFRLYELAAAKADQVRMNAGPPVDDALETTKSAATQVKDDLATATTDALKSASAPG